MTVDEWINEPGQAPGERAFRKHITFGMRYSRGSTRVRDVRQFLFALTDLDRARLGWGDGNGLAFKMHTHLPKVHGSCPKMRRKARRHKVPKAWRVVFARDGYACRKCGYSAVAFRELSERGLITHIRTGELTVDHVIPSSCGGTDDLFNLTTLCRACNTRRGSYLPDPETLL